MKVIDVYIEEKLFDPALALSYKICEMYPNEEDGYFALMKTFSAMNMFIHVEKTYNNWCELIEEEFMEPSETILNWYNIWKKEIGDLSNMK